MGWRMSFLRSLQGSEVLVFGSGVTGSDVARFLKKHGARVTQVDEKGDGVEIRRDLKQIELSRQSLGIVSPGWRLDNPLISEARSAGISIISEIDLAWRVKEEVYPNQIWLALTGTNGKTTTVQMCEAMLNESGISAKACGNVGDTAIGCVADSESAVLILELSSFQLSWSNEARFRAAAILNIAEDHIDWHGSFSAYADAKFRIADMSEKLIANLDDHTIEDGVTKVSIPVIAYTLNSPVMGQIGLVENLIVDRAFPAGDAEVLFELADIDPAIPHNVSNAMAAAALALIGGADYSAIATALRKFKLDKHRLELIADKDGIKWVDDSKATNPHAARAALNSATSSIWIAGGLAKGADMENLISSCAGRIKSAILIGSDAEIIAAAMAKFAPQIPIFRIANNKSGIELMREVVAIAQKDAKPGDTVLLAPACASMDQFKDYADRGESFATAVKEAIHAS